MKRTLIAICIGVLTLALNAPAQDNNQSSAGNGKKARRASTAQAATTGKSQTAVRNSGRVNTPRHASAQRFQPRAANVTNRNSTAVRQNNVRNDRVATDATVRHNAFNRDRNINRDRNVTVNSERTARLNRRNFQRNADVAVNRDRNVTINRERNINRTRNVTVVNNWRGERFAGRNYAAFRNYHRTWHDRGWWHSHYNRIIFVSGGWYFWNSGYWYPAWGYDPGYYYPYDGPIYGYGALTPDQVIVNVQQQLQQDGYYSGPVDGVLGPMTREAIAAFQADHGLAITSAIDEPTLATLGLV